MVCRVILKELLDVNEWGYFRRLLSCYSQRDDNRPFLHTACKSWLRSDVPRVPFETAVAQGPVGEGLAVMRRDNHF
jgi:hypothetical protein